MKRMIIHDDHLNNEEELPKTPINAGNGYTMYENQESGEGRMRRGQNSSTAKCSSRASSRYVARPRCR